MLQKHHRNKQ